MGTAEDISLTEVINYQFLCLADKRIDKLNNRAGLCNQTVATYSLNKTCSSPVIQTAGKYWD